MSARKRRDHFVSSPARGARCPTCRRSILVAMCDGLKERVDATPLVEPAFDRRMFQVLPDGTLLERRTFDGERLGEHRCAS